jgi:hypothetical protein
VALEPDAARFGQALQRNLPLDSLDFGFRYPRHKSGPSQKTCQEPGYTFSGTVLTLDYCP